MNEEGKYYKCRQCGNNTLKVEEKGNMVQGRCDTCGYNFNKPKRQKTNPLAMFNMFNKYSGLISVIVIIILLVAWSSLSGGIGEANNRINYREYVDSSLQSEIGLVNNTVNNIHTTVGILNDDIVSLVTRMNSAEGDISNLHALQQTMLDFQINLTSIDENLTKIWNEIYILQGAVADSFDVNLTATFYLNQTTDIRYCHFNVTVEKDTIDIKEVKLSTHYQKSNITLMNNSGFTQPQQYQWLNDTFNDNYYIHWFEANDLFYANFNITWDVSDYNTSKLDMTQIDNLLMINSLVYDLPEIWEEEINA